jgi:hypothetical protein
LFLLYKNTQQQPAAAKKLASDMLKSLLRGHHGPEVDAVVSDLVAKHSGEQQQLLLEFLQHMNSAKFAGPGEYAVALLRCQFAPLTVVCLLQVRS